jgi:hypothetical protein
MTERFVVLVTNPWYVVSLVAGAVAIGMWAGAMFTLLMLYLMRKREPKIENMTDALMAVDKEYRNG